MPSVEKILDKMRRSPGNVRFAELKKVCQHYFGAGYQDGSSHMIFDNPLGGRPMNIQDDNGKAKSYQVRQVLKTIDRWERS